MVVTTLVLAILAIILCPISIILSIYAFARVMALERSTHRVEYIEVPEKKKKEREDGDPPEERPVPRKPSNYPHY